MNKLPLYTGHPKPNAIARNCRSSSCLRYSSYQHFKWELKPLLRRTSLSPMSCKQWRNIVFANPVFWSVLVLSHIKPRQKAAKWRDQSRGRIRSLHLLETLPEEASKAALDALGDSTRDNIRVLKFHSRHQTVLKERVGTLISPSSLREVEVTGIKEAEPVTQVNLSDFVCLKPPETKVERLTLRHINIVKSPMPPFMVVSVTSLTELSLEGCSPSSCDIMLYIGHASQSKATFHLKMSPSLPPGTIGAVGRPPDAGEPPILVWLTAHITCHGCSPHFLFPGLTEITFMGMTDHVQTLLQGLQLLEIYQRLDKIKLSKCHFNATDLILYLSKMDNLTSLEISDSAAISTQSSMQLRQPAGPGQSAHGLSTSISQGAPR